MAVDARNPFKPTPMARLRRIDFGCGSAREAECLGFMSAADLAPGLGALPALDLLERFRRHPFIRLLVGDIARYAGQPIAIILARDAYAAEDLADLVEGGIRGNSLRS